MEENLMYSTICYTMTILNMFSHLFLAKQDSSHSMIEYKTDEDDFIGEREMRESHDDLSLVQPTSRPLN